jgi:hypothetical protein
MFRHYRSVLVLTAALVTPALVQAQDTSVKVAGGGIKVAGWQGKIDKAEAAKGLTQNDALLAKMGNDLHVKTGPQGAYWHPDNKATGNYTVKAKFTENEFMALNDHPHPYGVFIGGNDMGTDQQSYLYCMAYGNGTFIVRGFGPEPFRVDPPTGRPPVTAAVNKAAGKGSPVTQEIALSVKGDKVECSVNGTVVGTYDKANLVGAGKLKSTDGVYGIRFGHNTEAMVSGFGMTKN